MQSQIEYIATHYGFKHQCIKAVEKLLEEEFEITIRINEETENNDDGLHKQS